MAETRLWRQRGALAYASAGFGFRSGFFPDSWSQYVSWRVPIVAPSNIGVGAMSGLLRDNGWIGAWNQSYDAAQETRDEVDTTVTTTGLLSHFPRGTAYTDPAHPAAGLRRFEERTYTSVQWDHKQSCMADDRMTTCCFNVERDVTTNPYVPWDPTTHAPWDPTHAPWEPTL